MRGIPGLEAVQRDFGPKGVEFYYVYKTLAHPGMSGYVAPYTLEERLLHIAEAKRVLKTSISWLADNMANELRHAFGGHSNPQALYDPEGELIEMWTWSDAAELRDALGRLVGAVDPPTLPDDLGLPQFSMDRSSEGSAASGGTGGITRVERPGGARPLAIETIASTETDGEPFYVKLRAEGSPELFTTGTGALHLSFQVDPLYAVHWNNLVDPIRFVFEHGAELVTPPIGTAPKVEAEVDRAPREFLVRVEGAEPNGQLTLEVHYFACGDGEGSDAWCKAVSQSYRIHLRPDDDGGRVPGERGRDQGRFARMDTDGDGRVTEDEFFGPEEMFARMDSNADGVLEAHELDRFAGMGDPGEMRRARGFRGREGRRFPGPPRSFDRPSPPTPTNEDAGTLFLRQVLSEGHESGTDDVVDRAAARKAFEDLFDQLFDRIDANGDGRLDEDELRRSNGNERPRR